MEPIKIFFFAMASFFGIENQRILSGKTQVKVYPKEYRIEVVQQKIFALTPTENDRQLAKKEWEELYNLKSPNRQWSEELNYFSDKKIEFSESKKEITAKITLNYSHPNDMAVMGIWYDENKDRFIMNYIPEHRLKTKDGKRDGIFWNFDGNRNFSFTITPFATVPKNKKSSISLYLN
ncbi:hypothetical protein [Chryseobacterium gambrini]|uniref:hypothetical protein n=1 Tax=Chryseobacterium gambrini TaxID=373672 RepID=UPI0022F3ED1F|nr:hypothetical protein [Chryseobacterium gambrini]WBX99486.1 hypothetical protein PE065_09595 [Chryseobacterium gambrini]